MSRVLVVEDEQHIAEGVRFNLQADGHQVVVAETGEQALNLLLRDRSPFDVVVLDVMLPGKDGFDVASELRAAGQYVPILMLTARGREEDVLRGFESGADDYLPKPFELGILLARIGSLLRRRQWNEREAPPAAEASDSFQFCRPNARLRCDGGPGTGRNPPLDADGMPAAALSRVPPGQVVSRRTLLEDVWGLHESTTRARSTTLSSA
jgi:DNA-binding response OmpR family regulator